jgi:hypothetical protein
MQTDLYYRLHEIEKSEKISSLEICIIRFF